MSTKPNTTDDQLLISYRLLRRVVGWIGIMLPIVILVGESVLNGEWGIRESISSYYWSVWMRDVLVGSLCAIGVFMFSYRGEGWDNFAGNVACVTAIGVALFPTSQGEHYTAVGVAHYAFAAVLFLTLAYFCLISFRRNDPGLKPLPKKPLRNKIYVGCGITILACIALIGLVQVLPNESAVLRWQPVFVLEAFAIWAFGWSWLIKGKGLKLVQG